MRRSGLLALLLLGAAPAMAETCSRSTLASTDYAYARWCGDPATGGTLRVARRDGRLADYLAVPVDTYRELIRTHQVARFVSAEVEGRYRRAGAAPVPAVAPVAEAPRQAAPLRVARAEAPPRPLPELPLPTPPPPAPRR
jgi:hypothetical protein